MKISFHTGPAGIIARWPAYGPWRLEIVAAPEFLDWRLNDQPALGCQGDYDVAVQVGSLVKYQ